MAIIGLGTVFIVACIADLRGNRQTRRFTRLGFFAVVFGLLGGDPMAVGSALLGVVA